MPAPLALDLRLRIVRAVERGSDREAARRFAVSPSAAITLMQGVRATGSAAPARFGGHRLRPDAFRRADCQGQWRSWRPISQRVGFASRSSPVGKGSRSDRACCMTKPEQELDKIPMIA